jgi:hypothetical protein
MITFENEYTFAGAAPFDSTLASVTAPYVEADEA